MTVPEMPVGTMDDLARVETFFAEQLKLPDHEPLPPESIFDPVTPPRLALSKLPLPELAKVRDLCQDVMSFAPEARPGVVAQLTLGLGYLFALFERAMGADWPRLLKRIFMRAGPLPEQDLLQHPAPAGADATPSQCARDFRLFDRLSQLQGGKFRGAVVFNCVVGVVASGAVLYALASPVIDEERTRYTTIVEFCCLALIGLIYARGSTPERGKQIEPSRALGSHWGSQRWHQRWLEYRLLAERFRYVDLLLPLGADMVLNLAIAQKTNAIRMWHERYFEWSVISAAPSRQSVREYRDHALAVIAEQERYHVLNFQRRGRIAHLFHVIGNSAYFAALGICLFDIFAPSVHLEPMLHGLGLGSILFWSGLIPVISAATYAILTHAEYAKAADASGETFKHIRELYELLRAMQVTDELADKDSLRKMAPIVIEFAATAITESTGWHAMLRDKNVPH